MPEIKLQAINENLEHFIQFVSNFANKQGFSKKKILNIELATEEVLVNVVNYAYPNNKGDLKIRCNLISNDEFIIEIIDSGIPFNPLSIDEPDIAADISNREIGGLGIFLMRKFVDSVKYKRDKGTNILTFTVLKNEPH